MKSAVIYRQGEPASLGEVVLFAPRFPKPLACCCIYPRTLSANCILLRLAYLIFYSFSKCSTRNSSDQCNEQSGRDLILLLYFVFNFSFFVNTITNVNKAEPISQRLAPTALEPFWNYAQLIPTRFEMEIGSVSTPQQIKTRNSRLMLHGHYLHDLCLISF